MKVKYSNVTLPNMLYLCCNVPWNQWNPQSSSIIVENQSTNFYCHNLSTYSKFLNTAQIGNCSILKKGVDFEEW